jgi:hypothetical protein
MIPIRYKTAGMIPEYRSFYDGFRAKIEKWVAKGGISPTNMFDRESTRFFEFLLRGNNLFALLNKPAYKLPGVIDTLKSHFRGLGRQDTEIMKLCRVVFIRHGYDSTLANDHYKFPKNELIDDVGADVCPYCNRTFIKHVKGRKTDEAGNYIVVELKAQLDHFYDKDRYPYLAVSRYNLVPCCPTCNGIGGKYTDDVADTGIVNPFALKDAHGMAFNIDVGDSGLMAMSKLEKDIKIKIEYPTGSSLDKNVNTFNLQMLYDCHKDYAAELYKIHLFRQTQAYRDYIKALTEDSSSGICQEDVYRIMTGTYEDERDFNKRPLAKFSNDILEDLKGSEE